MEHPCKYCNAPVRDSSPFCPHCGAPQIRVVVHESEADIPAQPHDATAVAATTPLFGDAATRQTKSQLHMRVAVRAAAIAGALGAIAGALPVRGAFLLTVFVAGLVAALLYDHKIRGQLSLKIGFKLGALTGLFASAVFLVLAALETLLGHAESQLRDAIVDSIHQAQSRAPDEQARQALEYFLTPNGMLVMMILGSLFTVIVFVLLSGAGGAIFAVLWGNKSRSE